jgi:hypothetical protein
MRLTVKFTDSVELAAIEAPGALLGGVSSDVQNRGWFSAGDP